MDSDTTAMLSKYRDRLSEYRNFVKEQEEKVTTVELNMDEQQSRSPRRREVGGNAAGEGNGAVHRDPAAALGHSAVRRSAAAAGDGSTVSTTLNGGRTSSGASPAARRPGNAPAKSFTAPAPAAAAGSGVRRGIGDSVAASSSPRRQQPAVSPRRDGTPRHPQHRHDAKAAEEVYVDQLFKQQARYYTEAPPDAMYVKSRLWVQRRERGTEAARREREAERLAECTFAPRIDPSPPRSARSGGGGLNASSRGNSPGRVDDAVAQHLARLQAARRLKKEKEERQNRSPVPRRAGLHELTVPRGPNLGAPVAEPIPSLRKPYVPPSRSNSSSAGAMQTRGTATAAAVAAAGHPLRQRAVRRWLEGEDNTTGKAAERSAPNGKVASSSNGSSPAPPMAGKLDEAAGAQASKDKDAIIHEQRQRIISLEKELADMKAMVQRLQESVATLAAAAQQTKADVQEGKEEEARLEKKEGGGEQAATAAAAATGDVEAEKRNP